MHFVRFQGEYAPENKRFITFYGLLILICLFFGMISLIRENNWLLTKVIILLSVLIPAGVIAYELIILGKNSAVLLGDYPTSFGIVIMLYYSILFIGGIIWMIVQIKDLMSLKNENRKYELLHLQSQVNPHFFFNTLNNLYGLVERDPVKSKELILKLSDLMRYSIYEGEKNRVPIEEEVDYLRNYVELHKMRYYKSIEIQFNVNLEDKMLTVMPLLFIILLENAFKHGVENLRENSFVRINISSKNGEVDFEIENNLDPIELPQKEGIGLKNLKRRLELAYPKKYTLSFTNTNAVFKAQLRLQK